MTDPVKIDLSRYKTDEIASQIAGILSVPESIRSVLRTTIWAALLLIVANSLLYAIDHRAMFPWLLSTVYALAAGIAVGGFLGHVRVGGRLLDRAGDLMELTLETSRAVAMDYHTVQAGDKEMPPASEILEHVYEAIILPAMETSVSRSLGMAGQPLLFVYRRTIGGCVRCLIKRLRTESLTTDDNIAIEGEAASAIRQIAENAPAIERVLDRALESTHHATQIVRRMFVYPLRLLFVAVTLVALLPLALCWYWTR